MKEKKYQKFVKILGYSVFAGTRKECLDYLFSFNKVHVISGNPEVLYSGLNNRKLYDNFVSDEALIIPDGVGTQISGKILGTPFEEKIAGIDLMRAIVARCEKDKLPIYLFGATEDSLNSCAENLLKKHKDLNIIGRHNGYYDDEKLKKIIKEINEKKPFAIFVALGAPRQENFIVDNMEKLPCKIFMGVGGSFDVIGNKVKRAPNWMIKLGLEWAYRVGKEPWRIKRLGSIPKFLVKVIKSK